MHWETQWKLSCHSRIRCAKISTVSSMRQAAGCGRIKASKVSRETKVFRIKFISSGRARTRIVILVDGPMVSVVWGTQCEAATDAASRQWKACPRRALLKSSGLVSVDRVVGTEVSQLETRCLEQWHCHSKLHGQSRARTVYHLTDAGRAP